MNDRVEKRIELKAPVSRVWRALTDYQTALQWLILGVGDRQAVVVKPTH